MRNRRGTLIGKIAGTIGCFAVLVLTTGCMREYVWGPAYPEPARSSRLFLETETYKKAQSTKQFYIAWGALNLTPGKCPEIPEHGNWYIVIRRNIEDLLIFVLTGGFADSRTITIYLPRDSVESQTEQ